MNIIYLNTANEEAQIGLYQDHKLIQLETYLAHKELSATLLKKLTELLDKNSLKIKDIQGLVCYIGPGSFTGLRIGLSTANALRYALDIPITGIKEDEDIKEGIAKIIGSNSKAALIPHYGSEPHITVPKK